MANKSAFRAIPLVGAKKKKSSRALNAAITPTVETMERRVMLSVAPIVASFNGSNGDYPYNYGGLATDGSGNAYGTTYEGGASNEGVVFEMGHSSHVITDLADFNGTNGDYPEGGVVYVNGNLYGTATYGGSSNEGTVWELAAGSNSITALASFTGANGSYPEANVIVDSHGDIFGTALEGGANNDGDIWELPSGSSTINDLADFNGSNGSDPYSNLVADSNGDLFGVGYSGGANNEGDVFELPSESSTIVDLADFNGSNGTDPYGGMVLDSNGNLFGTTERGGANNEGDVWELPSGSSTINDIADFNGTNGYSGAGLVADSSGNMWGTTEYGGTTGECSGVIFEIASGSTSINPVYSFYSSVDHDAYYSIGSPAVDSNGDVFAPAYEGGSSDEGVVVELPGKSPFDYTVPSDGSGHNLVLSLDSTGTDLQLTDDGAVVESEPLADVTNVDITGAHDQDLTLTLDYDNGFFGLPISYDGGTGTGKHELVIQDSNGQGDGLTTGDVYTPGPGTGAGSLGVTLTGQMAPAGRISPHAEDGQPQSNISFVNLTPVLDTVPGTLTVDGTSSNDVISYGPGVVSPTNDGLITVNTLESIEFSNKTALTINTGNGVDSVNINNPYTPTGLTQINVNGGDSSQVDTLTEEGVPGPISGFEPNQFVVEPTSTGVGTLYDYQNGSPANSNPINQLVPVDYTGIGAIHIVGQLTTDQVQETNPGSHAEMTWTPGANPGSATITGDVITGFTFAPITYTGCQGGTFLGSGSGSGIDGGSTNITIDGTSGNDTFTYSDNTVNTAILSNSHGTYETLSWDPTSASENVTLDGGLGVNTFVFDLVAGTTPTNFTIATKSQTADTIDYNSAGDTSVDLYEGFATSLDAPTVDFSNESNINVNAGASKLEIEGTYYTASSIAYTPQLSDAGVFTSGPVTLEAVNVDELTVLPFTLGLVAGTFVANAPAGNDSITVSDGATIAGATQVAVNSLLPVQIEDLATQALVIQGGVGNDSLTVDSSTNPESIPVTFNGGVGENTLSLTGGTALSDTYTPGPATGAGQDVLNFAAGTETVTFTGLAPVDDSVAGPLTVNGPGGSNTIQYVEGNTATEGEVDVDNLEGIDFTNKTTLSLNAVHGSDQILINNANTPTGLTSISVNGGKGLSDLTVNAVGATVNVSTPGQVAVTGQPVVDYSNIQQVTILNALDEINLLPASIVGVEGASLNGVNVGAFTGGPLGAAPGDFTASISWGDATAASAGVVTAGFNIAGTHTYAEEGNYTTNITVTDPKTQGSAVIGGVPITVDYTGPLSQMAAGSATISDPAVVAAAVNSPTVNVATNSSTGNVKLATFTDPGGPESLADYGATIAWGDGNTTTGTITVAGGVFTVTGAHTYALMGTYSPTITISHDSTTPQVVSDTNRIVVTNAGGISATASSLSGQEGRVTSGTVAHFTVANASAPASAFWATINWGDGQSSSGTIVKDSAGHFHVTGSHVYSEELTYWFTVTIHEVGGFSSSVSTTATIAPSPLDQLAGVTAWRALDQTTISNLVLGTFRDQDASENNPTTFTGTINWGDGHTSNATFVLESSKYNVGSYWKIVGSHNYSSVVKKYTVTITFHDRGGPFTNSVITSTINIV